MPDRELRRRVVLRTRDGMIRILGVMDPSLHDLRDAADFSIIRNGTFKTVRALFVKATPRFALYREI